MSTMNIYDMADTWNDGATTFSAIKMSVTDTASASGSLLMDLQVGGVSKFSVSKAGRAIFQEQVFGTRFYNTSVPTQGFVFDSGLTYSDSASGFIVRRTSDFAGVTLAVDAANTLAQRNGVNAQAFRVYNTFTDASNYERGFMRWASNVLEIGTEAAGTGTLRNLKLSGGSGSPGSVLMSNGRVTVSGGDLTLATGANAMSLYTAASNVLRLTNSIAQGGAFQLTEMAAPPAAPAANDVRIYAEDDGAGKTRLMALFATGVAQQIAIEP